MRVTLDTAILVRTNAKAAGPARELLPIIQQTGAGLVLSRFLIEETRRVLLYPRMQKRYPLSEREIEEHIQNLERLAEIVEPFIGARIVQRDEADDPVVLTAIAGNADVLCTLDRHFYAPDVLTFCSRYGIRVMTDLELLHLLRTGS